MSRVELAARSGLTAGTITHLVRDLITEGLVHEVGRAPTVLGSPRRLLELDARAHYAVGVQLDRCSSTLVVTDFAGRRLASAALRGVGQDPPGVTLSVLAGHLLALLASAGVAHSDVLGVGLVTHGPQDRQRGVVLSDQPTPDWRGFPLTATLSVLLDLPVLLENDATAAAIGEQWAGSLDVDTFGVVYMASGVGGGVIVDSEVYRGRSSNAVELGHLTLDPDGPPCVCGSRGCVEAIAGPGAVVTAASSVPGLAGSLALSGRPDAYLADFQRIARAAVRGDEAAAALLADSARHIGIATVALMNLFDLDTVVLAGPAFGVAGSLYVRAMTDVVDQHALARLLRPVRVVLARDVRIAAAVGGALVVLRSSLGWPTAGPATAWARGRQHGDARIPLDAIAPA